MKKVAAQDGAVEQKSQSKKIVTDKMNLGKPVR